MFNFKSGFAPKGFSVKIKKGGKEPPFCKKIYDVFRSLEFLV